MVVMKKKVVLAIVLLFQIAFFALLLWSTFFQEKGFDIFEACRKGNLKIVAMLIRGSPELANARTQNGYTPLMFAAGSGNIKLVKYLISEGAEVHAKFEGGGGALGAAANEGHDEIVRIFIAEGADVNEKGGDLGK